MCPTARKSRSENNAYARFTLDNLGIYLSMNFSLLFRHLCFVKKDLSSDHKYYHGDLVESNVAKCSEPSDSYVGIWSIRAALLFGGCYCRRKLKLYCDVFEAKISILPLFTVKLPQQSTAHHRNVDYSE
ncbi:hypothetical protein KIN20_007492 [Parelaphostrongylus tenuis]|uniref:Uncharacterized protein n=1 Tax=Parelaphostrongylus tenuis TaxID=148309 RepID=A0AAD5M3H8_PARTN|nr:hypothetical protein KIN20_007492 [Parelaphostrongylus tenuis]